MRFPSPLSRHVAASALTLLLGACLGACKDKEVVPVVDGAACDSNPACASGLCLDAVCVDPEGDEDGDGLSNAFEVKLGSNPGQEDTDGDGKPDGDEADPHGETTDTDRDGKPDILESDTADADKDCVTDEQDPDDAAPAPDLSELVPEVCRFSGLCAEHYEALAARCADGKPVCDYGRVPGFVESETTCDGRDEDCDGRPDDGLEGCTPPSREPPGSGEERAAPMVGRESARDPVTPPATPAGEGKAQDPAKDRKVRPGAQPEGAPKAPTPAP
jgi:hypothetical protein